MQKNSGALPPIITPDPSHPRISLLTQKIGRALQAFGERLAEIPIPNVRRYEAARVTRIEDSTTQIRAEDAEARMSLRQLRARSRDLAHNSDHMKRFLELVETNVIGPEGVQLQVRATNPDGSLNDAINQKIQSLWWKWGDSIDTASANGKLDWPGIQRLAMRTIARDGEALLQGVYMENSFGFGVHFVSVDWLDETHNTTNQKNENRILMGVELDRYDREAGYWLTPPPSEKFYRQLDTPQTRQRVDAGTFIHPFVLVDGQQTRGVPWAHTALTRLNHLKEYEKSELVAARTGAAKMGFYKQKEEGFTGTTPAPTNTQTQLIEEVEPGMIVELPPGYEFQSYSPDHPNSGFSAFVDHVLRSVAMGLGVSPISLSGDYSKANYSSARIGSIDERDMWKVLQWFAVKRICAPLYRLWLRQILLKGLITPQEFQAASSPLWQPRGWDWVDPATDQSAKVTGLQNYLTTYTAACAAQGIDFDDLLAQRADERKRAEAKGITLPF